MENKVVDEIQKLGAVWPTSHPTKKPARLDLKQAMRIVRFLAPDRLNSPLMFVGPHGENAETNIVEYRDGWSDMRVGTHFGGDVTDPFTCHEGSVLKIRGDVIGQLTKIKRTGKNQGTGMHARLTDLERKVDMITEMLKASGNSPDNELP